MSYKSIFATLLLATSSFAAVVPTCSTAPIKTLGVPAGQTTIPDRTDAPSFALLGVGVQNYTCTAAGTYTSAGAVAELFDISCLAGKPAYKNVQTMAYNIWKNIPEKITSSKCRGLLSGPLGLVSAGQHYFITNAAGGISPKWDMMKNGVAGTVGKAGAFVVAAKVAGLPAPKTPVDVDWLQLKNVEGKLAADIYRTDTVAGPAPASCVPGSAPISVKYTSKYLLYGSTVGQ